MQNLEGANVFDKNSEQAVEYAALEGSLQMMSQVLNVSSSNGVLLSSSDLPMPTGCPRLLKNGARRFLLRLSTIFFP